MRCVRVDDDDGGEMVFDVDDGLKRLLLVEGRKGRAVGRQHVHVLVDSYEAIATDDGRGEVVMLLSFVCWQHNNLWRRTGRCRTRLRLCLSPMVMCARCCTSAELQTRKAKKGETGCMVYANDRWRVEVERTGNNKPTSETR